MTDSKILGNIYGFNGGNFDGNVYDPSAISPTILSRDYKGPKEIIEIKKVDMNECRNKMPSRAEQSRAEQSSLNAVA